MDMRESVFYICYQAIILLPACFLHINNFVDHDKLTNNRSPSTCCFFGLKHIIILISQIKYSLKYVSFVKIINHILIVAKRKYFKILIFCSNAIKY